MIRVEAPEAPLDQWSVWAVTGTHNKKTVSEIRSTKNLCGSWDDQKPCKKQIFCQCSKV